MAMSLPIHALRWVLLVALVATSGVSVVVAQLSGANAGAAPGTYSLPSASRNERPLAKRIFFPPDPPPLGAQINIDYRRPPAGDVPNELAKYVAEPFYAPLSTWLDDLNPSSERTRRARRLRLEAYLELREQLLVTLRGTIATQAAAPAEARVATFVALAEQQAAGLTRLENEAEAIRADLAEETGWYDLRRWKLGAGGLRKRQPEHRVLEFQLVRAAAFYQPGLSPPQRRLLREAAMLMQDEMSAAVAPATGPEPAPASLPRLVFFAPDLVRLLPPPDLPAALTDRLEAFAVGKDRLRGDLVNAIIAGDKVAFASERRRALARLAAAQAERLSALELQAEEIRQEYALEFERRRLPRPYALPGPLLARIEDFLDKRAALHAEIDQRLLSVNRQVQSTYRGNDPRELQNLQAQARQEAINRFSEWHATTLLELDVQREEIHQALVACVGEAALQTASRSSSAFLTEYMTKYRQSWAYYEYELAVFQAGLSAAQRRLLVGGAVRGLALPLPRAELQPTTLPRTLLNDEQKVVGIELP